jgi:S-DNA-T family DNA segregation ATPase FtsK/SpoIIIE
MSAPETQKVLFSEVIGKINPTTSSEQLYFTLGRTPDGKDVFKNLAECPHLLVGGSTGSGKTVSCLLCCHHSYCCTPHPRICNLCFPRRAGGLNPFRGLPHLVGGKVFSDATKPCTPSRTSCSKNSARRQKLLADARVENIIRFNETHEEKPRPWSLLSTSSLT